VSALAKELDLSKLNAAGARFVFELVKVGRQVKEHPSVRNAPATFETLKQLPDAIEILKRLDRGSDGPSAEPAAELTPYLREAADDIGRIQSYLQWLGRPKGERGPRPASRKEVERLAARHSRRLDRLADYVAPAHTQPARARPGSPGRPRAARR
jgi:hypothetical protein